MSNNKQEQKKSDTKQFAIEYTYSDSDSNKYVIFRRNYYEAKEEAESIQNDHNKESTPRITGVFVKEVQIK